MPQAPLEGENSKLKYILNFFYEHYLFGVSIFSILVAIILISFLTLALNITSNSPSLQTSALIAEKQREHDIEALKHFYPTFVHLGDPADAALGEIFNTGDPYLFIKNSALPIVTDTLQKITLLQIPQLYDQVAMDKLFAARASLEKAYHLELDLLNVFLEIFENNISITSGDSAGEKLVEDIQYQKISAMTICVYLYSSYGIDIRTLTDEPKTPPVIPSASNNTPVPTFAPVTSANNVSKQFNISSLDGYKSGNVLFAMGYVNEMASKGENTWAGAEQVSIDSLQKSPYSYLGKLIIMNGQVNYIDRESPQPEYYLITLNLNSSLGTTRLYLAYKGDASVIKENEYLSCSGYFIGIHEAKNTMGGTIEVMDMVGNSCMPYQQPQYGITPYNTTGDESGIIPVTTSNSRVDLSSQKPINGAKIIDFYSASPYFMDFKGEPPGNNQYISLAGSTTINGHQIEVEIYGDNYDNLDTALIKIYQMSPSEADASKYLKDFASVADADLLNNNAQLINDMIMAFTDPQIKNVDRGLNGRRVRLGYGNDQDLGYGGDPTSVSKRTEFLISIPI